MMLKKGKKEKNPKADYFDSKRKAILNMSEAKRNLYSSKLKEKKHK